VAGSRDFARAYYEVIGRFRPQQDGPVGLPGPQSDRINTVASLDAWLRDVGGGEVNVTEVERRVKPDPGIAWDVVLGSGIRRALADFLLDEVDAVRAEFLAVLRQREIDSVDFGTLVGVGLRP
jgi:hypothetical protein